MTEGGKRSTKTKFPKRIAKCCRLRFVSGNCEMRTQCIGQTIQVGHGQS